MVVPLAPMEGCFMYPAPPEQELLERERQTLAMLEAGAERLGMSCGVQIIEQLKSGQL